MAVRRLTVKNIISRIRQTFPEAPDNYLYNLINDALLEAGLYRTKVEYAKATTVKDQMWYDLSDTGSSVDINKVFRVDFMDSAGDYIKIPRMLDNEILNTGIIHFINNLVWFWSIRAQGAGGLHGARVRPARCDCQRVRGCGGDYGRRGIVVPVDARNRDVDRDGRADGGQAPYSEAGGLRGAMS